MAEVIICPRGPFRIEVCAPFGMTLAEIEREANRRVPTGIREPWAKADEPFDEANPNPSPCAGHRGERVHYLLSC